MDEMPTPQPRRPGLASIAWAWISVGALALGSFGPWIRSPLGGSISGLDGSNDGWLTLGAAVIAALALARIQIAPGRRVVGRVLLIVLAAAFAAFVAYHDRENVSHVKLVEVGWGLNLTLVAAISLGLAAIAVHAARPKPARQSPDLEDTLS
jgi:hypothetical protein